MYSSQPAPCTCNKLINTFRILHEVMIQGLITTQRLNLTAQDACSICSRYDLKRGSCNLEGQRNVVSSDK